MNFRQSAFFRTVMTIGLLLGMALGGTGCDMKLPPMPWDPKPDPKSAQAEKDAKDADGAEAGEDGEAKETPKSGKAAPLDLNRLLPPAMRNLPYKEVNVPLSDRMLLYGRLYDPSLKPPKPKGEDAEETEAETGDTEKGDEAEGEEAEGPKPYTGPRYPLVILIHGLNRDHTVWNDLPAMLVKAGYAVLALDLRGHGKSDRTFHHQRVGWRLFKKEQWLQLPHDIGEVIAFFHEKKADYPEVDRDNVILIGEKLGANVAVFAARDARKSVKAMVLLSPALDFKGLIASQAIVECTSPTLFLASQDDEGSAQVAEKLYNWILAPKTLQIYERGIGGEMLTAPNASVGPRIVDWLQEYAPPTRVSSAPIPAIPKETATEGDHE